MASDIERRITELTDEITVLTEKREKLVAALEIIREDGDHPGGRRTIPAARLLTKASMTFAIVSAIREVGGGKPVTPTQIVAALLRTPEYRKKDPKQLAKAVADRLSRRRNVFHRVRKGLYVVDGSRHAPTRAAISPATVESTSDIIRDEVARNPGATTSEIADRVVRRAHIASDDKRRVALTRIGQLVRDQKLLKDDDRRLFLPDRQLELNGANGHP
jgi:hypothetical protein